MLRLTRSDILKRGSMDGYMTKFAILDYPCTVLVRYLSYDIDHEQRINRFDAPYWSACNCTKLQS